MQQNGDRPLRVAVLGGLEVRHGPRAAPLGPIQQQVVLGALLLRLDQPVSRDRLIDDVWGDSPPSSAVQLVHRHTSNLRRLLQPEHESRSATSLLRWNNSAYQLCLRPGSLDVEQFDLGLAQARRERAAGDLRGAAGTLRGALDLWRGPLLEGLRSPFLDAERDRLAERRLEALEDQIELDLLAGSSFGSGSGSDHVTELRRLIAEQPARERLRSLLMIALCQGGRSAHALIAYQETRRYLRDELGIDPSVALRQLHQRILDGDPSLAPPVTDLRVGRASLPPLAVPSQLPHALSDFVGRGNEIAQLQQALDDRGDALLIVAITGTAGVGKTALAVRWAHQVKAAFPDGQIHLNLRGFDPHQPPITPAAAIRALLDALGIPAPEVPLEPEAQIGHYRSLLAGRRVLIVLDNARDAEQVRPLLPGAPGCAVVVTSRDQLVSLVAVDGARPVSLDLLTSEAARQLLRSRLGGDRVGSEPAAVEAIIEACARLPLALSIVAARARTRSALAGLAEELRDARGSLDPFDGGELAVNVRAVLSWSYARLDTAAAGMFRLLALAPGPDVPIGVAASLTGLPRPRARHLLNELTRASLLSERAPGRFVMHDLLRAYADELVQQMTGPSSAVVAAASERVLDHYLHTAYRADHLLNQFRDDPITLPPAVDGVTPEQPADHLQALSWFAAEQPALLAAVRRAADLGFDRHAWQLAWTLTHFLDRHGHWQESAAAQEIGVRAAENLGDLRGQAVGHGGLAYALIRLDRPAEAQIRLESTLELYRRLDDGLGRAHAHRTFTWLLDRGGQHEAALEHAQEALDLFTRFGSTSGQARALNSVGWAHCKLGRHEEALEYLHRALDLQTRLGPRFTRADTLDSMGVAYRELRRFEEAASRFEAAISIYREFGDRYNEADCRVQLGEVRLEIGDRVGARASWEQALRVFEQLGHPEAEVVRARLKKLDESSSPG